MITMAKGLGSKIEKITKATGIKAVVDKVSEVTGKPCGCEERKNKLDERFPAKGYFRPSEYDYIKAFFERYNGHRLQSQEEKNMILAIYNRVNESNQKPSNCTSCINRIIENLRTKMKQYEEA